MTNNVQCASALAAVAAIAIVTMSSRHALADGCDAILKRGIRDTNHTFSERQHAQQMQYWMCESQFSEYSVAESSAKSIGIGIDIFSLNFGGASAKTEWSRWYSSFCASNHEQVAWQAKNMSLVKTTSRAITQAWSQCIEDTKRTGVIGWLTPTGSKLFTVTLQYKPPQGVTHAEVYNWSKKGTGWSCTTGLPNRLGNATSTVACSRVSEETDVLFVVNTSRGSVRIDWPGRKAASFVKPNLAPSLACMSSDARLSSNRLDIKVGGNCVLCSAPTGVNKVSRWNDVARVTASSASNEALPATMEAFVEPTCAVVAGGATRLLTRTRVKAHAGWGTVQPKHGHFHPSSASVSGVASTAFNVQRLGQHCLYVPKAHNHSDGVKSTAGSHAFNDRAMPARSFTVASPSGATTTLEGGTLIRLNEVGPWTISNDLNRRYTSGWNETSGSYVIREGVDIQFIPWGAGGCTVP